MPTRHPIAAKSAATWNPMPELAPMMMIFFIVEQVGLEIFFRGLSGGLF